MNKGAGDSSVEKSPAPNLIKPPLLMVRFTDIYLSAVFEIKSL